jgi:hypothetical protein
MKGAGDKKTKRVPAVPGPDAVALLYDLTRFREALARSIARNNLVLRSDQIAAAVNRILFPLLLLRIAEDRTLIPEGTLADLRNCRDTSRLIRDLSAYADPLYSDNSSISPPLPDPGDDFVIESRAVLLVLDTLTSRDRRYDLQDMSIPVISEVLMQYLTQTIRRSAAHQATVVDTHDTVLSGRTVVPPELLVCHLTRQALAYTRMNRSEQALIPIRVCDPACGSGTVLLAVYNTLVETAGGEALTFDERREILMNSVHGLDINRHAVAATRMLLFLELCTGPRMNRPGEDFPLIFRSVLRELLHTVLCGNALVGPEIVEDESWMFCPARDRHTLNPFSFRDRFPEIFAGGGFDAVVCNPPEGALEQREWIQQYFQRRYSAYHPHIDRSAYFTEKSLSLVSPGGMVSCLLSGRWLRGAAGSPLREVLRTRQIEEIADLSSVPQENSGAGLCLLHVRATPPSHPLVAVVGDSAYIEDPVAFPVSRRFPVNPQELDDGGWVLRDTRTEAILRKVHRHSTTLENFVMDQVHHGPSLDKEDPLLIHEPLAKEFLKKDPQCKALFRRVISGPEIGRYQTGPGGRYLLLIPRGWTSSHIKPGKKPWQWFRHRHPQIARYLQSHAELLKARAGPALFWWESSCDEFWQLPRKKILFPLQFSSLAFLYDSGRGIGDATTCAIPSAGLYAAGLLNSRLMAFVFDHTVRQSLSDRNSFTWDDLRELPLFTPDLDRPEDLARYDRMEYLVRRLIDLEKNFRMAKADPEREALQKKIHATDRQIDALVYDLYGLMPEEIAVVEANSALKTK